MFQSNFWAKVTDNADPDGLQRVKIGKADEAEGVSGWLQVVTPFAGGDNGLTMLPDIDDEVLVVSLGAAGTEKVILGGAWNNDAEPPETGENSGADRNQDGKNALKFIKSRLGHMFVFDDTEDAGKIQIITSDGKSRMEFDEAEELINIDSENDIGISAKGSITVSAEEIEITSKKQLSLDIKEYALLAKKGLGIDTDKDLSVNGKGISLN